MKATDPFESTRKNRSMPMGDVVAVLGYRDVREAVQWLTRVFGLVERLQIGMHRAQLSFGNTGIVAAQLDASAANHAGVVYQTHSILARVLDVDAHYERAASTGATIVSAPMDHPFGERQYSAIDVGGHRWTFSQTIADVDPADWGGTVPR